MKIIKHFSFYTNFASGNFFYVFNFIFEKKRKFSDSLSHTQPKKLFQIQLEMRQNQSSIARQKNLVYKKIGWTKINIFSGVDYVQRVFLFNFHRIVIPVIILDGIYLDLGGSLADPAATPLLVNNCDSTVESSRNIFNVRSRFQQNFFSFFLVVDTIMCVHNVASTCAEKTSFGIETRVFGWVFHNMFLAVIYVCGKRN